METPEEDARTFKPMGRLQAFGLTLWGPPDTPGNPLHGTKYDPHLRQQRQHESLVKRRERWTIRKEHLHQRFDSVTHRHA